MSKFTYYTCTSLVPESRSPRSLPTIRFHPDAYEAPKGRKQRLLNLPPDCTQSGGTLVVALLYLTHASGKGLDQSLQPVSHEGTDWPPDCHGFLITADYQLWTYYLQSGLLLFWTLLHCFSHYRHTAIYCVYSNSSCVTKQRFRMAPLSRPRPSLTCCV